MATNIGTFCLAIFLILLIETMSLFLEAIVWDFIWGLLLPERRVKELTLEESYSDGTLNLTVTALSES